MAGNTFGEIFKVTTFGESHGEAMGCIVDGCPAGLEISISDIEEELKRRRPNSALGSRDEEDKPEILSGIYQGKTLGTPIAIIVRNTNQKSSDYDELKEIYRPSHADFTWEAKYGFRDHRGGGRSSGRETLSRVAAGAIAKKFLLINGITISAVMTPSISAEKLEELKKEGDSAGGIIHCEVKAGTTGLLVGLGEPVFDKLDARLAAAILSIGACKGIEFGAGFSSANMKGSEYNALPCSGILGGISSGKDLSFNAVFKPTPSIAKKQKALAKDGSTKDIEIKGRHDVCIVPRAVPVVEAMTAITIADFLLLSRCARI
ncbi:MAG: chorismate synthase [Treponema sp.]|nr:chorismate synthase [Treponema sp.]